MYINTYVQCYYQISFSFLTFTQVTFHVQLAWFICVQMKLLNYFQICKHVQKFLKSIHKVRVISPPQAVRRTFRYEEKVRGSFTYTLNSCFAIVYNIKMHFWGKYFSTEPLVGVPNFDKKFLFFNFSLLWPQKGRPIQQK